jgi:hypothetical protein
MVSPSMMRSTTVSSPAGSAGAVEEPNPGSVVADAGGGREPLVAGALVDDPAGVVGSGRVTEEGEEAPGATSLSLSVVAARATTRAAAEPRSTRSCAHWGRAR